MSGVTVSKIITDSFEELANAMPQLVWIANAAGTVTYYNNRITEFRGAEILSNGQWKWDGLIHPDDQQATLDAWAKAAASGTLYEMEHRMMMRNGTYRWFLSRALPQKDKNNRVLKWYGTATDVHQQKKAEESLKFSEAEFRAIFEISTAGMVQVDEHGKFLRVNTAFCELIGYSHVELQNMSLYDITHPEDSHLSKLNRIGKDGETICAFEKRYIKKSGEVVWVIVAANCVFDTKGKIKHTVGVIQDITGRRNIEQSLERLATHLKISTDSAHAGTWFFDAATEKLEWSDLHKELWGYEIDRTDLVYEDWYGLIHADDIDLVFRNLEHARVHRTMYEAEYRITRKSDGVELWMHSVGQYLYNENQEPVSATGISIDITEKKNREKELLEVKEQLEITVKNVPAGIILFDKKLQIVFANQRASEFLSLNIGSDSLRKMGLDEIRSSGNRNYTVLDEWDNPISDNGPSPAKTAFETGISSEGVYKIQYPNGEKPKWFFYTCNPLLDEKGEASMVLSTMTDITIQKEAEQKIRQSEEQLRTLAESIPQLVWMSDTVGNCEYKTRRWFEYSGLTVNDEDILERMIHPDDFERISDVWGGSWQKGNAFREEVRLRNFKGEYRWHALSGEPIRNADGEISKWIGVFTDIDEQKISSVKLEKLVAQRTSELHRSNEDLQQFAHVASHDLKEPLRKIKIFGTRLAQEYEKDLPEVARVYLSKIDGAANRMFTMIDGVLQYSSLNASLQTPEKVDLNGVMESIESDLEVSIEQTGAVIQYEHLPTIDGAPVLIYQLLYNLINNSLKFSKTDERPVISVTANMCGNDEIPSIKLVIQDNGIGFEEEYTERIFHSFSRLNTKDRYEGTGLGLALCKKIVERHHGSIVAKGTLGVGATFVVHLPLNQHGQMI